MRTRLIPRSSILRHAGALGALLLVATTAHAQPPRRQPTASVSPHADGASQGGRVDVLLAAGATRATPVSQSFSLTKNLEPAPVTATTQAVWSSGLEGTLRVRVAGPLRVELSVDHTRSQPVATVDAEIPHPFYFSQPRAISGSSPSLNRSATGLHATVSGTLRVTRRLGIDIGGGLSRIALQQALVTDVAWTDRYPFDSATFASATVTDASGTATGAHALLAVHWQAGPRVAVVWRTRATLARTALQAGSLPSVTVNAGGLTPTLGLRVTF